MYKEFIKIIRNTMIYGIADIAPKVVGFFMIPVYTRFLTPSDYGIMSMSGGQVEKERGKIGAYPQLFCL